jgi:hypothetical protein
MAETFTPRYRELADAIDYAAHCQLIGEPVEPEIANLISAHAYAARKDSPARIWWDCQPYHPAIARALRIDRSQTGGVYALAPFRLWNDGTRHLIIAAYPCPRILGPIDLDHLGITSVLAWNPLDDTAAILGDHTPGLFGSEGDGDEAFTLYASPREYLTAWAINRAHRYVSITTLRQNQWADAEDRDASPGALAVGPIDKINLTHLPREFAAQGFDVGALNRAILRQARVPRAHAIQNRAAA